MSLPVANAGPDQTVAPWSTVTLTSAASTPGSGGAAYSGSVARTGSGKLTVVGVAPPADARITNTFSGGTLGATVTTGNSGGTSGIAPSVIGIGGTAALTYSSTGARVSPGARAVNGATGRTNMRWDFAEDAGGVISARWYQTYNGALPGVIHNLAGFINSAGSQVIVDALIADKIRIVDITKVKAGDTSPTLAVDTLYRFEVQLKKGTAAPATDGQIAMQIFEGAGTTPIVSAVSVVADTGNTNWVSVRLGDFANDRAVDYTIDDVVIDPTTQTPIGPA